MAAAGGSYYIELAYETRHIVKSAPLISLPRYCKY